MNKDELSQAADEMLQLRRDAARWQWVKENAAMAAADFGKGEKWTVVMFRLQLQAATLGVSIDREIEKGEGK